jgi:hypothetical protein
MEAKKGAGPLACINGYFGVLLQATVTANRRMAT